MYPQSLLEGYANSSEGRKILFQAHLQRARRIWGPVIIAWSVASIFASRLSGMREGPFELFDIVGALLCGVTIGTVMSWFETRPLRPGFVNRYPWLDVGMRAAIYTGAVFVTMLLGRLLLFNFFPDEIRGEHWRPIANMWNDIPIRRFIFLMFFASFALNFILHLRLSLGPKNMLAMFTGRYRMPVKEKRLFLFIDLIDSTAIAERLGPLDFTHFKHDFFCAIAQPLMSTSGTIVQYVGDEVMLTWRTKDISEKACPFAFIEKSRQRINVQTDYFKQRYGVLPTFRSGIHAGEVVVAEVGDTRRDIVYSGDVVNSAARLLQACRPEGRELLISDDASSLIHEGFRQNLQLHGQMNLRGRKGEMEVFTISA
ncbi:MAG: adenylate/guanylate cyclase domain-containing protein [Saprospiraceae bacterium]